MNFLGKHPAPYSIKVQNQDMYILHTVYLYKAQRVLAICMKIFMLKKHYTPPGLWDQLIEI